jgi:hypothetical protein
MAFQDLRNGDHIQAFEYGHDIREIDLAFAYLQAFFRSASGIGNMNMAYIWPEFCEIRSKVYARGIAVELCMAQVHAQAHVQLAQDRDDLFTILKEA